MYSTIDESKLWKFHVGDEVETAERYAVEKYNIKTCIQNPVVKKSVREYHRGKIITITSCRELLDSLITFLDTQTNEMMLLREIDLKLYDGIPKNFRDGQLISGTTIEDVLNGESK